MKKTYEKPRVYMERFELAEHIAQCGITVYYNPTSNCGVDATTPGGEFNYTAFCGGVCTPGYESICYTTGLDISSTLNS